MIHPREPATEAPLGFLFLVFPKKGHDVAKAPKFSVNTYRYFDGADKNAPKKSWFESNRGLYEDAVKEPFSYLLEQIQEQHGRSLPKIKIEASKVTRPLRPSNRAAELGFVKNFSFATLCEKNKSRFEWNPAIHIQFGAEKQDNLIGIGIYMVSSRQMSRLRSALVDDFDSIDSILNEKNLQKRWGGLAGEKYKRFPKAFDP
ncbi:MAG: DUF2461 family protein, partial [Pseudomonadota bacterium]